MIEDRRAVVPVGRAVGGAGLGVDLQRQRRGGLGQQPDPGIQGRQAERAISPEDLPARMNGAAGVELTFGLTNRANPMVEINRQGTPPITRTSARDACIRSMRPMVTAPPPSAHIVPVTAVHRV